MSVLGGAGADNFNVTATTFDSSDSISGGTANDTITLTANSQTVVDSDFSQVTSVEKLTTADGSNSLTLGTKADDSGLATVTGGAGVDTINASAFVGSLTISAAGGADVITTQSGDYNLSVNAGAADDTINIVGAQPTTDDSIDGGANTDTIVLSVDAATIVDADFTNIDNVEKLTTAGGAN